MPTPTALERAQRFIDLHAGDELFVMANPTNTGIAAMLEQLGYVALGTSSAALARSLGRRDGENAVVIHEAVLARGGFHLEEAAVHEKRDRAVVAHVDM